MRKSVNKYSSSFAWIKMFSIIAMFFTLFAFPLTGQDLSQEGQKKIIGATELVDVIDVGLVFKARVDTGAKTTSIHAKNIRVHNASPKMRDNVGKKITFRVINELNESATVTTEIIKVSKHRTSEGSDRRYKVYLFLHCQGIRKRILVSLNDRSKMKYKLLLGRNWLKNDFLVDVDINSDN